MAFTLSGMPSTIELIELLAALMVPAGLYWVLTNTRTLNWADMLIGIGMLIIPTVVILGIEGVITPSAGALMIGLALGHTMAMFDTD